MAERDELALALQGLLGDSLGAPDVEVTGLRRLGGGSSRENWAFEATSAAAGFTDRALLLRRDPPASVADTDRAAEVGVLSALAATDLPTPVVVAVDLGATRTGRPSVILERAAGRADRSVLRARDPLALGPDGQRRLAEQLCDLLATVHTFDPAAIGLTEVLGPPPADPAAAEIERWTAAIEATTVGAQPELAFVATWLWEHRPAPPAQVTLVHGDFRPANVLVDGGAAGTLLDWEFAHLGDPAEDLGWYTAPIYRTEHFGEDGPWDAEQFLARYAEHTGPGPAAATTDADRLRFWQVLALYKLGAIAVAGIDSFLHHGSDRAAGPADRILRLGVASVLEPA